MHLQKILLTILVWFHVTTRILLTRYRSFAVKILSLGTLSGQFFQVNVFYLKRHLLLNYKFTQTQWLQQLPQIRFAASACRLMNKYLAHYFIVAPENLSTQLTGLVFTKGKYSKFDAIMSYFNFGFFPGRCH